MKMTPEQLTEELRADRAKLADNLRFIWQNTEGFWAWWAILGPLTLPVLWYGAIIATIVKVWWPR